MSNTIEECFIQIAEQTGFQISSGIFFSRHLRKLQLSWCTINTQLGFPRFTSLIFLGLQGVTCSANTVQRIVSASPLLEQLYLKFLHGCGFLEIKAENLSFLTVFGTTGLISLMNVPRLKNLIIEAKLEDEERHLPCCVRHFIRCLTSIENMTICGFVLESLYIGGLNSTFPSTPSMIRVLKLRSVSFIKSQVQSTCWLIRASRLEILEVEENESEELDEEAGQDEEAEQEEEAEQDEEAEDVFDGFSLLDASLAHLCTAELQINVRGDAQLRLISLLLSSSPNMKKLCLQSTDPVSEEDKEAALQKIRAFDRASPSVEIEFL